MSTLVEQFLEKSRYVETIEELNTLFEETIRQMGFHSWAYQLTPSPKEIEKSPVIIGSYPTEWVEHYINCNYSEIDPIVQDGHKELTPFQWSHFLEKINLSPTQIKFFNEADDFKLGDGVGIPIHGFSGAYSTVSMVSELPTKDLHKQLKECQDHIHIMSLVYHQIAKEIIDRAPKDHTIKLTAREEECLLWTAKGKTTWEISKILAISERTVIFHIENSKAKLGVSSRHHAVVRAIMNNIIHV